MQEWLGSLSLVMKILGVPSLAAVVMLTWRYVVRPSIDLTYRLNAGMVKLEAFDLTEFKTCVSDVQRIKEAVGPNGGRSLYDRAETAFRSARLNEARLSTMIDVVVDRPMFEANSAGDFTWCNRALENTYETSCDNMAGRGWINLILPEDRDRVVRELRHAVADRRSFQTMARFVTQRAGATVMARFSAQPIVDESAGEPVVIAWMGAIDAQPTEGAK